MEGEHVMSHNKRLTFTSPFSGSAAHVTKPRRDLKRQNQSDGEAGEGAREAIFQGSFPLTLRQTWEPFSHNMLAGSEGILWMGYICVYLITRGYMVTEVRVLNWRVVKTKYKYKTKAFFSPFPFTSVFVVYWVLFLNLWLWLWVIFFKPIAFAVYIFFTLM